LNALTATPVQGWSIDQYNALSVEQRNRLSADAVVALGPVSQG